MNNYIQVNTANEGTHIVKYNCADECGNNSIEKIRNIYISGDGDDITHGRILIEPRFVMHKRGRNYIDNIVIGHNVIPLDILNRIHDIPVYTNTSEVNINVIGTYLVTYSGYLTLPNGSQQIIVGARTVQVYDDFFPPPPIIRIPIDDIFDDEELSYLNFGINPDVPDPGIQPGSGGGGGVDLINELCAMISISAQSYGYNRKIMIRKDGNISTIMDEENSINLTNLYQELTKGDSSESISIINNNSYELNPYVDNENYITTGPLVNNTLSYNGNWDILLIVDVNSNTKMEYGFLYDINNNKWNIKTYIINSSYIETVESNEISGTTLEIAGLDINYISLCLDDPLITIIGDNPITHEVKTTYNDQGATAIDDLGNTITVNVTNNINHNVIGSYSVIYSASDTYGNSTTAIRTVNVNDTIAPVITLLGDNPMTIEALSDFSDPGANAVDNYDTSINVTASSNVNTSTVGNYTITYSASDNSSNTSSKTRTVKVVNTTPPTLTILGNNPYNLNVFTDFIDPGATATDALGVSVNVSSTNNINKNVLGNYSVIYSAIDNYGNTQTATRIVNVVDISNPTISLLGDNPMEVDLNGTYSEPGAIGYDNYTNPINVSITGTVNTLIVGNYIISYSASDSSDNSTSATRTVKVINNTPPTLTLNGTNPLYHEVNTTFTDPGASGIDVYGNVLQVSYVSNVNEDVLGNYTITYSATDSDNNTHSVTRNVIVRDSTSPVITLIGNSSITLQLNSSYTELGATATDNYDTDVSVSFSGTVDTSLPGIYIITYTATDSSNNTATKTRNILVENNDPPIITVLGNDPVTLALNASYTDAGATAVDAVGNTIYVSSTSTVNTSQYGTYAVYYSATDIWGNTGYGRRNVIVSDFTAPTITLIGPPSMTIILGQVFTDPGATGYDPADGTVPVSSTGNVNINLIGEYVITYRAQDGEGRETTITRTVIVTAGPGGGTGGGGGILGGGISLSPSNFVSNGCININLSLPALAGYTGSNPSINRAIIIRTPDNGGTPVYLYDNGTRNQYKYPNSPLNMSGTVFDLEKSDPDYELSIIDDEGDFLEPEFYISSYNSDNWTNITPISDDYFGGNWEIISIQGNWSSGQSVVVTTFAFDILNTRWKTRSYTKSNTSGSIYKINNWSENTFNGAGPHDIAGITVQFNLECIIPQCANVSYSAGSYSFSREIFTKYENSVISAWNEIDNPSMIGDLEIMCAPFPSGGFVTVKNTDNKILSVFTASTTFTNGPVTKTDLSLEGNWELIVSDYSNSATNTLQHAIFYSGLYNKWYRNTYIFNNGVVTNMTSGEEIGNSITLANITFTHNGFNNTTIEKPLSVGHTHTILWLYGSSSISTESTSIILDTTYPVSWTLTNHAIAGVLSYTNSGNLVITYRKNLVLGGGTNGTGGYEDYPFTYTATADINNQTFNYTINVTHRYYNPSGGGGGGGGGDPPGDNNDIIKDINDFNDPLNPGGF